ncbi:MAG: RHS repeat-associated core domain-containing protein, partial [Pirellulaceae bacterium]|nr:RHS repeat-associated core domain-containing protein [Pirellulaceae bacterium]
QNFNAAGNRTELKATIGSTLDFRNTYQFDTLGRVTEMIQQSQAGGNAVTAKRAVFEYNKLNQRTSLTRYQSTGTSNFVAATDYTYDTVNRLSSLTHKQNSTVLAGYTYGYDGLSRLSSVTSTIEGLSTYTYDATSQVVGADHAVGGQADETYGYDLNGNRNTSGYTTSTNNRTTADPGFTYTYDDQGNRTSRTETSTGKVTEYSWDHRNRLVTVKDRNTAGGSVVKQVDYAYDAFNRLVKRTFDADGAGSGTATNQYWVYDEGINAVLQFEGSSASNLSHRYLWSDRVDELMADETVGSGADTLYALSDHLGTIRDIANFNESTAVTSVTNRRTYNSFGKLVSETNAAVDLIFGYTGKQLDEATGLQHNLFRWYDSGLGQWLSEDPMGFAAGDENMKRYVGNEQIRLLDPNGLEETWLAVPANAAYGLYLGFAEAGSIIAHSTVGQIGVDLSYWDESAERLWAAARVPEGTRRMSNLSLNVGMLAATGAAGCTQSMTFIVPTRGGGLSLAGGAATLTTATTTSTTVTVQGCWVVTATGGAGGLIALATGGTGGGPPPLTREQILKTIESLRKEARENRERIEDITQQIEKARGLAKADLENQRRLLMVILKKGHEQIDLMLKEMGL